MTRHEGLIVIFVEGDSSLVINTIKKLHQGIQWEKISKRWKTSRVIQEISEIISGFNYIIPSHVISTRNEATNFLANWGCLHLGKNIDH